MKREINEKLTEILIRRSGIDFSEKTELKNEKLLGMKIGLPARELLHIYFDIERIFNIGIPEEEIVAGNFDTFEHISEIVERQLAS